MDISIATFSFHGALGEGVIDVFGYLEACRYRYHLRTADIWNGLLGADEETQLSLDRAQKVRKAMDERDLVCVNYHADGCHIWEEDFEVRAKHRDLTYRHFKVAEILGASTVRIDPGGRERHWTEEQFDCITETYREYAEHAGSAGFKIGPETHWGPSNFADNMLKLHTAVGSPYYGILLHMGKGDDPTGYDTDLAPIAIHTHLDQRTCFERVDEALTILWDAGYRGALGVEHHTGKNEYSEVEAQIGMVRRAISRFRFGRSGQYGGNPLLDPINERSNN